MLISETKSASSAAALGRKEWLKHTRKRCEISCLNEYLPGAAEFGYHSFAAKKAPEKTTLGCLSEVVLHVALPCDEMTGIDDVLFPRTQNLG